MAGNKYLKIDTNGDVAEVAANQTSAGAGDAGKIVALNSSGLIDDTMLPTVAAITMVASEDLSAGNFVNIFNSSGTIKVRKADATNVAKRAHGFVKAAFLTGATATVYTGDDTNTNLSGMTLGAAEFLSTSSAGGVQETVTTTATQFVQRLGVAYATTAMVVGIDPTIYVRA